MNRPLGVPYSGNVTDYFQDYFDGVYAVLHPFMKVLPQHQSLLDALANGELAKAQFQAIAQPVSWQSVLELTGVPTIQRLNQLLLEGIGAASMRHCPEVRELRERLQLHHIFEPGEGAFPELLLDNLLHSFADWGYDCVWVSNEFGDRTTRYQVSELLSREFLGVGEHHPTLYSEDSGLMYGVHWNSFYTFLCGLREVVSEIVAKYQFEGFFFEPGMKVYWGN